MDYYSIGDFAVQEINIENCMMLLKWRNSPEIHSKMLTDHIITEHEHLEWVRKIKDDVNKHNFFFTYKDKPIGYLGYADINIGEHSCLPGVYLAPNTEMPKNAGFYLFFIMNDYAFSKMNMMSLRTEVFEDNKVALWMNKLFGYESVPTGDSIVIKDRIEKKVKNFVLTRDHWLEIKSGLLDFMEGV